MAQEVLALLDLKDSKSILDVGCGDGKITAEIAARSPGGSVVGVDPSRDMIAFAQSHFGPATRPNLRFEVADARSLPFKHEFDLVVSFNALHWIPEQDAALTSIHSALISDGRAQLRLVVAGARKSLEYVVEETRQTSKWSAYFQDFHDPYLRLTSDEYAAMAKRNALPSAGCRDKGSCLGFWVTRGFCSFLRSRLRRMDAPFARSQTAGVHQRYPGPLPSHSRRWPRRRKHLQVLSDGYQPARNC